MQPLPSSVSTDSISLRQADGELSLEEEKIASASTGPERGTLLYQTISMFVSQLRKLLREKGYVLILVLIVLYQGGEIVVGGWIASLLIEYAHCLNVRSLAPT